MTAERIGVEPPYLRRLEAGTVNPSLAVLLSVAHAFGVTLASLVADERDAPPSASRQPPGR